MTMFRNKNVLTKSLDIIFQSEMQNKYSANYSVNYFCSISWVKDLNQSVLNVVHAHHITNHNLTHCFDLSYN